MANKVSVIPLIDTSYSMTDYGYVEMTVIDSKAFVRKVLPKDRIAVAKFDETAKVIYPASGMQEVDENLTVLQEAVKAIDNLRFDGDRTDIGGGIQAARSRLDSAPDPRGIVLLSDGRHNYGTPPLTVLPSYPIYTCAMGPASDQKLLEEIATKTNGKYYYMPRPVDLMKILNDIRGKAPNTSVTRNSLHPIPARDFELLPVNIMDRNHRVQFSVVWESRQYRYGDRPGAYTLAITLVDPDGCTRDDKPIAVEPGYAIFSLIAPKPGQWQVQIEYGGPANPLHVTVGAFEYQSAGKSALELKVAAPAAIEAGEALPIEVQAFQEEKEVTDLTLQVAVAKPKLSLANALRVFGDQLAGVGELPRDLAYTSLPEEHVRLFALRQRLLPQEDILGSVRAPVATTRKTSGGLVANLQDTEQAGSYTFEIEASGTSPVSGLPFGRTSIVSVLVR
jgi:hypothetical protein